MLVWHSLTFYTSLRVEGGHAEDTLMEGEVNLILLCRHRPVCNDSNMSNRLPKITHLFGWEQGIGIMCMCVCFKENAEECGFFLLAAPMHLTV